MQAVNTRAALLSNYEVLRFLKEREQAQTIQARANLVKKEDAEEANGPTHELVPGTAQNVRTVQFETLSYLSTPPLKTMMQDESSIAALMKALRPFDTLTKVEKLQIVNLLPTTLVELFVIVEELEERFTEDEMQQLIDIVRQTTRSASIKPPLDSTAEDIIADEDVDAEADIDDGEGWFEGDTELQDGPKWGGEDDLADDGLNDDDED